MNPPDPLLWRIANQSHPTIANTRGPLAYEDARKQVRGFARRGLVAVSSVSTFRGPRVCYQATAQGLRALGRADLIPVWFPASTLPALP